MYLVNRDTEKALNIKVRRKS